MITIPFPQLPDNWNKTLLSIGIVLISSSFLGIYHFDNKNSIEVNKFNNKLDSLSKLTLNIEKMQSVNEDFLYVLKLRENNDKIDTVRNADIRELLFEYSRLTNLELIEKILLRERNRYEGELDFLKYMIKFCFAVFAIGLMFCTIGLFLGIAEQNKRNKMLKWQLIQDNGMWVFNKCQSCGRRFSSALEYGTKNDGIKSAAYCIMCYKNGEFIEPNLSFGEVKKRAKSKIKHLPKLYQKYIIWNLSTLQRWNKNQY